MFYHLQNFPLVFQTKLPLWDPNTHLIQWRCLPFMKSGEELLKTKQSGQQGEQAFSLKKAKSFSLFFFSREDIL